MISPIEAAKTRIFKKPCYGNVCVNKKTSLNEGSLS
jgi:hypothetical protein